MSLHLSVISIEGDHMAEVSEIFELCNFRLDGSPRVFRSVAELNEELEEVMIGKTKVKKVSYFENGWTSIMDFELVMISDETVWCELSKKWETTVLCWVCEGASGTYMLSLYRGGKKIRDLSCCNGELTESGDPIPEEDGIDWREAFEDDVLTVAERLGAPYGCLENDGEHHVYLLDESHLLPSN
jgi:hypothetical protein